MSEQLAFTGQRKSVSVELKVDDEGQFEAIFSTFDVIDHDGDVTLAGAFEDGAEVVVGAYGHSSWMGELPVGKGVIKTTDKDARIVGSFFLNTASGKEHHAVAKELGTKQEWSYGYRILQEGNIDDLPNELSGARRVLAKVAVDEASQVLKGAGIDTHTVVVKQKKEDEEAAAIVQGLAIKEFARFVRTRNRLRQA